MPVPLPEDVAEAERVAGLDACDGAGTQRIGLLASSRYPIKKICIHNLGDNSVQNLLPSGGFALNPGGSRQLAQNIGDPEGLLATLKNKGFLAVHSGNTVTLLRSSDTAASLWKSGGPGPKAAFFKLLDAAVHTE